MTAARIVAAMDVGLLLSTAAEIIRMRRSASFLVGAADSCTETGPRRPLVLLIPVWREQGTVSATINRLHEATATRPWLRAYLLTSDDDGAIDRPSSFGSTTAAAAAVLQASEPRQGQVAVVSCPTGMHTKAEKLRWAFSQRDLFANQPNVGIFDADSHPDHAVFDHVARRLERSEGSELVLQQTALHVCTHDADMRYAWLVNGHAIRQNRWALHFELGRLLREHRLPLIIRPFNYIVGHGVFFTWLTFERAIPTADIKADDARMSAQLRTSSIRLEAVPTFDRCEVPPTLSGVVAQKARWFQGPLHAWGHVAAARRARATRQWFVLDGLEAAKFSCHALYWIFGPILFLIGVPGVLIAQHQFGLLTAHAVGVIAHAWGVDAQAVRTLQRLGVRASVATRPSITTSVATWALWGCCALIGLWFTVSRSHGPERAQRSWERFES